MPLSRRLSRLLICLLALAGSLLYGRERQLADDGWSFHLGDAEGAQAPGFPAKSWRPVTLPHDWSIELPVDPQAPGAGDVGYFQTGIGWYRRTFDAPRSWRGRQVWLEFEGSYMNTEVWLNGEKLASHVYGYTPFRVDLTPALQPGKPNVIAVRVDNSHQSNTRWYSGSGLYRHVWLNVARAVHVAPDGVFVAAKRLDPEAALLRVETAVENRADAAQSITVRTVILDERGKRVAETETNGFAAAGADMLIAPEVTVPQPKLWSPDTPVLYTVKTYVSSNDGDDEAEASFGIRQVRVSPERGLELNGQPLKLVGGNAHHDHGPLGAASFDRAEERKVQLLKAAGFNAVRTSHNPPAPAFLEACDRLGLLVMAEAFDGWAKKKNPHDYGEVFEQDWQGDLDAFIRRDRNHPSIVLWSIGNEVYERGNADGERIARMLTERVRQLDATRPITAGLNGLDVWTKLDPVFATLDVAGYNYELGRHAEDHARLPGRVIVSTESYPSDTFANWAICQDNPYVIGDFVWSAIDYLGESSIGEVFAPDKPVVKHWEGDHFPWHGAACGDIDLTGWRKPVSHYRNLVWNRGERLYVSVHVPAPGDKAWNLSPWASMPALPTWFWPGEEGKLLQVEVFSRFPSARLYLDGQLLGEKPTTRKEQFKAVFEVPYRAGSLEAAGVEDGVVRERIVLVTPGKPARLRLSADRSKMAADGQDLTFVTVEMQDAMGVWVANSEVPVRYSVSGPATIAGIGSADLTTTESYRANPRKLYQGRSLVVLRAGGKNGRVTLTASAPGMPAQTLALEVKGR